MNKKGFMFVETIVTLTVLMALLLTLYAVFVNLLQKEKVNAEYDKYGDKAALFYYKESLLVANSNAIEQKSGQIDYVYLFGLDKSPDYEKRCNVAIIDCNNNIKLEFLHKLNDCGTISQEFKDYKNQLDCPNNKYIILGEFYNGELYNYAHIIYPNI